MTWNEKYNCYSARVGAFVMCVNWSMTGGGFEVSFGGVKLKRKVPDLEPAKAAALALARRLLTEALAELEKA